MLPVMAARQRAFTHALRALNSSSRYYSQQKQTVSLQNLETRWKTLAPAEKSIITKHLEELQTKDWKTLSLKEKKAVYYVAFGAHGPREPLTQPGHASKVVAGVIGVLTVSSGLMYLTRAYGAETPHTTSPEWREKTNEYLRSQNSNPIHGISSEGYKGKGY
ncbi:cytochrome c oxidase subunit IV [Zychaea mexicana]|uniref:cytochrome c oxidase subunit IV n=1 Tax=Zychaea mexicana TaxID=64656 RepID=UPI0022FE48C4|nr:cytochrome c oxidase subunit IV [Zychaea mexicana]KAI9495048.1 cytochrome c oxidase subunit IV [Zychaea mexicana]